VDVDAVEAEGELVGARLRHEGRARLEQPPNGRRRLPSHSVGSLPVGIARARGKAFHIVEILGDEGRAGEGTRGGAGHGKLADDAVEGAKGIDEGHIWVLPPWRGFAHVKRKARSRLR
jgi:hypothetical protein